jgi:DNA replication and repair protein RecF
VRLTSLHLRHFRNLGFQDLDLPPSGVAIVGENGQGKSNLIEAIYYLETLRSFRGARDAELIGFGEEVFRVEGALEGAIGERRIAAAFSKRPKRKKVTVDGAEAERLGSAIGGVAAVVFSPADVTVVSGAPSDRRRFMDVVLALNARGYLEALQRYRHTLAQRNTALRQQRSVEEVRAWDGELAQSAARIMRERSHWVAAYGSVFCQRHASIAGGPARLRYEPSVEMTGAEEVEGLQAAMADALVRESARERRLGTTVVGPHLDELAIEAEHPQDGWLDLRRFGSGGQKRTAALALRLAEGRTIRDARGEAPLVLLDDVFAELDQGRSERVLALLESEDPGQVIVTAPKESDLAIGRDTLPRWSIRDGRIVA